MRTPRRLLAALALAAGLGSLLTAPAAGVAEPDAPFTLGGFKLLPAHPAGKAARSASAQDDGPYLIGSLADGRCLDADLNTIAANGTKVQLWTCNSTAGQQAWYFEEIPEGFYRFRNYANGRYLDADADTIAANGTKVQLWDYVGGGRNQWWAVIGIPEGYARLRNVQSSRYLDADANTIGRDGTKVQLWDYMGGARNQWWQ
ncbi:MAG TPA: RICIN domain-containing protein [Amycolatopsis sp.]|uniref:RICIN domain-containing protein n=1 Tax=Amycolatopsis sp. TaxID=37632 RepID=UPI002B4893E2|nr:RICIN domain-containing protein [Amycolatopsis sp.]HKS47061.1 RICIN domain-containing protein [Amycolatopsis sp.]